MSAAGNLAQSRILGLLLKFLSLRFLASAGQLFFSQKAEKVGSINQIWNEHITKYEDFNYFLCESQL